MKTKHLIVNAINIFMEVDHSMSGILEETEAQRQKVFENICSLLVSAGYFRARIPALSPYDKVNPTPITFSNFHSYNFILCFLIGCWRNGMVFNR